MSIDVVTLTLAKAYADDVAATGGNPGKLEEIVQDKVDQALGELGSVGGADWSVNDETASGYIKNRPFYSGIVENTLLDGTFDGFKKDEESGIYSYAQESSLIFEEGKTYTVVFDGTSYSCIGYISPDVTPTILGNASIAGVSGGNNEPFLIFVNEGYLYIYANLTSASHTVKITVLEEGIKKIDEKYLPDEIRKISSKMDKENPTGAGSFNLNRKPDTTIGICSFAEGNFTTASGAYSHAEGSSTTASGESSHAEGYETTASGYHSHAEGNGTKASGEQSHAEGVNTTASGYHSHAEGQGTKASGEQSHAEGIHTTASGHYSHAEGYGTTASGEQSHAEGYGTTASGKSTHVQGEFNIEQRGSANARSTYAHIVGNGLSDLSRSNAHTLDWSGNAWFAGNIKIGGSGYDDATAKTLATIDDIQILVPKSKTITLTAADWNGDASPYNQTVTVDGITAMSKIDIQPTLEQVLELQESAITLMILNDNGTATAYAIGSKPTKDYTMKILITETR